jgi:hypothetical protein
MAIVVGTDMLFSKVPNSHIFCAVLFKGVGTKQVSRSQAKMMASFEGFEEVRRS